MSVTMGYILVGILGLLLGYMIGTREAGNRMARMFSNMLETAKNKVEETKNGKGND